MSGLDVIRDRIMEIACVITDSDLNLIAQHPEIIINQPSHILDQMDEWCTKQHGAVSKIVNFVNYTGGAISLYSK